MMREGVIDEERNLKYKRTIALRMAIDNFLITYQNFTSKSKLVISFFSRLTI